jgi:predicted metal-dependent phosphoesterase TrpH
LIDLHIHTTASDGTYTPGQVVNAAAAMGLEALAITDHDNFAGYDEAAPLAEAAGLDLVCSIELSTRRFQANSPRGKSVHVLGYFLDAPPSAEFRGWLRTLQLARRDRNRRLVARLQELGVDIRLEEAEAIGRIMTGRPHFARILVKKGYASSYQEAFDVYLDESAKAYVQRLEPSLSEGLERITSAGGLPSLAHPMRLGKRNPAEEEQLIGEMCKVGLRGIEAYHCDHSPADEGRYLAIARSYGLAVTGGSDFHGDIKPELKLGTGFGNLSIPRAVLDRLRESVRV